MIKKGDFVSISYSGKLVDSGSIFDTTDEAVAKAAQIYDKRKSYTPITICVGENQVLEGLDESIVGKAIGAKYSVLCLAEKAFGKKDASKIQLIPLAKFKQQQINPVVGMTVYVDNRMGFVKTVGSGRALVDFNHPFAGKAVEYQVFVVAKVDDPQKQVQAVLNLTLKEGTATVEDTVAHIKTSQVLPEPFQKIMKTHIQKLVPSITDVTFSGALHTTAGVDVVSGNDAKLKVKKVKKAKTVTE
jgi:FKBP-type peptidyl-prolyl cis-trans isomerase 2